MRPRIVGADAVRQAGLIVYTSAMTFRMDRRAIAVVDSGSHGHAGPEAAYWRSRPAAERIAAVEFLRRQSHGSGARLQRVLRVTERAPR